MQHNIELRDDVTLQNQHFSVHRVSGESIAIVSTISCRGSSQDVPGTEHLFKASREFHSRAIANDNECETDTSVKLSPAEYFEGENWVSPHGPETIKWIIGPEGLIEFNTESFGSCSSSSIAIGSEDDGNLRSDPIGADATGSLSDPVAMLAGGEVTITSQSGDIWGTADSFFYASVLVSNTVFSLEVYSEDGVGAQGAEP